MKKYEVDIVELVSKMYEITPEEAGYKKIQDGEETYYIDLLDEVSLQMSNPN